MSRKPQTLRIEVSADDQQNKPPESHGGPTDKPPQQPPAAGSLATDSRPVDAYLALAPASRDTMTISRVMDTGQLAHLFTVDAAIPPEKTMERLRADYGPGEYQFQARREGRIEKTFRLSVEAQPERGAALAAKTPGQIDMQTFLLQQLTAQQNQNTQIMSALVGRPATPGTDFVKLLSVGIPLLAPFVTTFAEMLKGSKPDALDIMEKAEKIKQLIGAEGNQRGATAYDVLMEGMRSLAPLVERGLDQQGRTVASQPAAIAGPARTADSADKTPITRAQIPGNHPLIVLLSQLVNAAVKDAEPELYAEVTFDQWPGTEQQLRALAAAPDWLESLARFEPRVTAHSEWFKQMHAGLVAIFQEIDAPAAQPPPAADSTEPLPSAGGTE